MSKIRVLVVEDNSLTATAIEVTLKKNSLGPIHICESGEEAIKIFKKEEIDLVLMDIMLAGAMDGISTAQVLREHRRAPVIYLTDHSDPKMVERAKKTYPANYLSKPFNDRDLVRAVELAFNNMQELVEETDVVQREHVFLKTDKHGYVKIAYKEILFLEAARSYCNVVTDSATYLLCSSMNQVQDKLGNKDFMRVHRKHVVNTKRITRVDGNVLYLDEKKVDMGREFRDDLMNSLKLVK